MLPLAAPSDVTVRALDPASTSDLALLQRWLNDPRVLEWYEGRDHPFDEAMVRTRFGPGGEHESEGVRQAVIESNGQPVGYIQFYPVGDWAAEYEIDDATDTWAIDIFIGEPAEWSRGIGSSALRALVEGLFTHEGAVRVLIDPRVINERAIRAYEKAGFRKVKVLKDHEDHEGQKWDNLLMEATAGATP